MDNLEVVKNSTSPSLRQAADLLGDVATLLMTSGAHTARVMRNVTRMANAFGYDAELSVFQLSIMISVCDKKNPLQHLTIIRKTEPLSLNFSILSKISILSWRTIDDKLSIREVREAFNEIKTTKRYSRWIVLLLVSIANASFCRLFGGDIYAMGLVGLGTFLGLFARQEMHHRGANHYIIFIVAAFIASFVAGMGFRYNISTTPEIALAASVLYLIPGVPLLNSITDIIEGHVLTGTSRAVNTCTTIFCIALGLLLSMLTLGLDKL
jgi:uncharacterized membrane protein YjjP (DUF1212 family)